MGAWISRSGGFSRLFGAQQSHRRQIEHLTTHHAHDRSISEIIAAPSAMSG